MAAGKLCLMGLTLLLAACSAEAPPQNPPQRLPVTIAGRTFQLELALTEAAQRTGLSHRDHLDSDGGMLFVFRHARMREFWMKDCLIPIDAIFLDPGGRVLAMHAMTPEPGVSDGDLKRYTSKWPA